jgi:hypothetical protein
MKTFTRKTVLTLLATLTAVSLVSSVAVAAPPKKTLLIAPGEPHGPGISLPKFGFASFNINGFGERITYVKWNGRAAQLGLEPGDVILSLNGYPLNYHGSWNDALAQAMYEGGWVQLKVRDVHTGYVAYRETYIDCGYGPPVTHKYQVGYGVGPQKPHVIHHHDGHNGNGNGNTVKKIVNLIDELNDD